MATKNLNSTLAKEFRYLVILVLLFLSGSFIFGRPFFCRLLDGRLSEIEKVRIAYYGTRPYPDADSTVILTPEKDRDLISSLYNKVKSTLTWMASEREETLNSGYSDEPFPFFQIEFFYRNGESDIIDSEESGRKILRHTSSCLDWCEGSGKNVLPLVKEALERGKMR